MEASSGSQRSNRSRLSGSSRYARTNPRAHCAAADPETDPQADADAGRKAPAGTGALATLDLHLAAHALPDGESFAGRGTFGRRQRPREPEPDRYSQSADAASLGRSCAMTDRGAASATTLHVF